MRRPSLGNLLYHRFISNHEPRCLVGMLAGSPTSTAPIYLHLAAYSRQETFDLAIAMDNFWHLAPATTLIALYFTIKGVVSRLAL